MRYRYSDYPIDLLRGLLTYQELVKLFLQLVLQTGGDVEEALRWMRYLQERGMIDEGIDLDAFRKELEKSEIVEDRGGSLALSAAGERRIRRSALEEIFTSLSKSGPGYHAIPRAGGGGDLLPETRPDEFGHNPTAIDGVRTIGNAVRRDAEEIAFKPEDFEVHEEEHLTSCATVLAIDISHSMILYGEDRFTPAKKVAMALSQLIRTQYPGDSLQLVLFHDSAEEVPMSQLARVQVGPYYTNTCEGLKLAQRLLTRQRKDMKQIVMITDGKPSALTLEDGRIYKNAFGLDPLVISQTLEEVARCKKQGILINTFMLASDYVLVNFVQKVTEICRGKAYFTTPFTLGQYLLMDYMSRKTKTIH